MQYPADPTIATPDDTNAALEAKVQSLSDELEAIAYFASHDFQEPLVVQTMFIRILQHELERELSSEAALAIDAITTSGQRMQAMVNAMLAFSRAGRAKLNLQQVDLDDLLQSVSRKFSSRIKEAGAAVDVQPLGSTQCDPALVSLIFEHLLDNALKFRGEGVAPEIAIAAEICEGRHVFLVRDNGIGIEAEVLPRVLRPFGRHHPKDRYPGVGVGLAISKKFVELHGGRIWLESAAGEGTKVMFTLQP